MLDARSLDAPSAGGRPAATSRARFTLRPGRRRLRARASSRARRRGRARTSAIAAGSTTTAAFWRRWLGASTLPRSLARDGAPLGAHAEAAHLRADGRDRRRPDDEPPRAARRRRATGTTATRGCATRRSRSTRCCGSGSPRRPARSWSGWRSASASTRPTESGPLQIMYGIDGRADLERGGARPPRGLPRLGAGADRQRRGEPAPARHLRRADRLGLPLQQVRARRSPTTAGWSSRAISSG